MSRLLRSVRCQFANRFPVPGSPLVRYNENTKSIPPQLVHLARSGSVDPRSRMSYGRFAATSPAMSSPMSPPIPEYTATYCLPSGPVYVIGFPTTPDPTLHFHSSLPDDAST